MQNHLESGLQIINSNNFIMKSIVKMSTLILLFFSLSFSLSYLKLDLDSSFLWDNYSKNILPSLFISWSTIWLTDFLEAKRNKDINSKQIN